MYFTQSKYHIKWWIHFCSKRYVFLRSDQILRLLFFHCSFLCGYYSRAAFISLENPQTSMTAGIGTYEQYSDDCSTHSLSVLLSAVEMSHTTQTALALAVDHSQKLFAYVCVCAVYTSHGYYSRVVFISLKSFQLCGYYSRAVSIWRNTISMHSIKASAHTYCEVYHDYLVQLQSDCW